MMSFDKEMEKKNRAKEIRRERPFFLGKTVKTKNKKNKAICEI